MLMRYSHLFFFYYTLKSGIYFTFVEHFTETSPNQRSGISDRCTQIYLYYWIRLVLYKFARMMLYLSSVN